MIQPLSLDEFLALANNAKRVAVFKNISIDQVNPIDVYEILKIKLKEGVIFEKSSPSMRPHYTYLLFDPFATISVNSGLIEEIIDNKIVKSEGNPFDVLRDFEKKLLFSARSDVSDLISSAIGFVTYDAIRYIESIPDCHKEESSFPDIQFNFFRINITFDHLNATLLISTMVDVSDDPQNDFLQAQEKIDRLIELIKKKPDRSTNTHEGIKQNLTIEVDVSDEKFMQMVAKAKEYIKRGDAFQIVISRCFKLKYTATPLHIYKILRDISPAPFMFFIPTASEVIIGASPERFIQVQQKHVNINPIAGTCKYNNSKDNFDLLNDKKEVAEHMMLVDLARNDIGRVAKPGSVKVNELLKVKNYSHVSHITSEVSGQLQHQFDRFDALVAAFPAGTLSGAPKIRAMQVIDELEISRRGLYGGVICRLDYRGDLDSCIAIRMAVLKEGVASIRAGAGIVYDSNPLAEAQETRNKAQSICEAICRTHGAQT